MTLCVLRGADLMLWRLVSEDAPIGTLYSWWDHAVFGPDDVLVLLPGEVCINGMEHRPVLYRGEVWYVGSPGIELLKEIE